MKAIVVKQSDKEPILSWQDVPDVTYGPEQVLVDIKATAVNRADLLQAQGYILRRRENRKSWDWKCAVWLRPSVPRPKAGRSAIGCWDFCPAAVMRSRWPFIRKC